MDAALEQKYADLTSWLAGAGSVAVAFSGGVDSTLLARVAHDVLGASMIAVTAVLRSSKARELAAARAWCAEEGIEHLTLDISEFEVEGYAENPPERCYLCKRAIFKILLDAAAARGIAHVIDGTNTDDEGDWRPGMRALAELGIDSPLRACNFSKADVRVLSRELGLPTWDLPSAACLASRIPYGSRISEEKLRRIEAAEDVLADLGFGQVRVRTHGEAGTLARIEVPRDEIGRLVELKASITERLRALGYAYVAADLEGFRSGALNEVL